MKVLHVTDADLPARHFNGFDLLDDLAGHGIAGSQVVLRKFSNDPRVTTLLRGPADEELQERLLQVERRHSMDGLLFPWGRLLAQTPEFEDADVVHYHLIHKHVLSLYDIRWLFGLKPSVWTFHDPWPLTGHCIHPMESTGWLTGCAPCPYLRREFPMADDRASEMFEIKHRIYADLDVDVVVASPWLLDMVRRSPLGSTFPNVHLIPFGLDTRRFAADQDKNESRRRLGVPVGDFVVLVRESSWEAKGLQHAIAALEMRTPNSPTTVLTVDERGLLSALASEYRLIELGWVDDDELYPLAFSACDVFLMPSLAESFGLMAIEAMAAGRPVVCFEGTALPAVTHAPECGIAVPWADAAALRAQLDRLAADPSERNRRGNLGRAIVATEYAHEHYLDALAGLYESVLTRHDRRRRPAGDDAA